MRRVLIGALAGMMIPLCSAYADIEGDLKAGLPMDQIIKNATAKENEGLSVAQAVAQIAKANPAMAAQAVAAAAQISPNQAAAFAKAAAEAAPAKAIAIAEAAAQAVPEASDAVIQAVQNAAPKTEPGAIEVAAKQGVLTAMNARLAESDVKDTTVMQAALEAVRNAQKDLLAARSKLPVHPLNQTPAAPQPTFPAVPVSQPSTGGPSGSPT